MQSLNDDEQKAVLSEVMSSQLQAILEYVKEIPAIKQELREVREIAETTRGDASVIKKVVVAHKSDLTKVKRRLAI